MSWRPEDWDELKVNAWGEATVIGEQFPVGFEAGADAMLEALGTWHTGDFGTKWRIETIRDMEISLPFRKDTKGWLVLIPDDEE